ncbi:hypothetical protein FE844_013420 [Rhizobium indicum]|uniref:hypothetical protein n=1 Tax=Rhizobium indicum TaxID=2583231 RepID=UPI0011057641|nr:hypothetical protein [Rhizobium indicum]QKK30512.1 hypothetical protein FE844_013420 [Rhizobium indicum]
MTSTQVVILGFVGALAPEIVRLYSIRAAPSKFRWSNFYVAVSVLFASLGGLIAWTLPATTPWAALYAGISTPAIVTLAAKKATPKTRQVKGPNDRLSYLRSFIEGL